MMKNIFLLTTVFGAILTLARESPATVLTFNITPIPPNNQPIFNNAPTYGHKVSGDGVPNAAFDYDMGNGWTPNIGIAYDTATRFIDNASFGGKVIYPPTSTPLVITLTPDPTYSVTINSFRTITWANGSFVVGVLAVRDLADNVLWSASPGTLAGTTDFTPAYTGAPSQALKLHLVFDAAGDVALDNFSFDQVAIPEPASGALLLAGATLVLRSRSRKLNSRG